jgi:hypothetical protein
MGKTTTLCSPARTTTHCPTPRYVEMTSYFPAGTEKRNVPDQGTLWGNLIASMATVRPPRSTLTDRGLGVGTVGSGDATMGPGPHSLTRPVITPTLEVAPARVEESANVAPEKASKKARAKAQWATLNRTLFIIESPFNPVANKTPSVPST